MTKGEKQSFRHFTNQKQLRLTEDPNYPVEKLSGDASTDNRQTVAQPDEDIMALEALQAQSGMFMHPMHDVTKTEQVNGDQVLEALQAELDELEDQMAKEKAESDLQHLRNTVDYGMHEVTDPNERTQQ